MCNLSCLFDTLNKCTVIYIQVLINHHLKLMIFFEHLLPIQELSEIALFSNPIFIIKKKKLVYINFKMFNFFILILISFTESCYLDLRIWR